MVSAFLHIIQMYIKKIVNKSLMQRFPYSLDGS